MSVVPTFNQENYLNTLSEIIVHKEKLSSGKKFDHVKGYSVNLI